MEARPVEALPTGDDWQYEPKWDGFRALVFRDGEDVTIQSKSGQPIERFFPEVAERVRSLHPRRFVIDAELVIPVNGRLSFDALLRRLQPSATQVSRLAESAPARLMVFDLLLADRGAPLVDAPLEKRRRRLEAFASRNLHDGGVQLSPASLDVSEAREWLAQAGTNYDGVVAKRRSQAYTPGGRSAMVKVKNVRGADCIVAGFRYSSRGPTLGSLLLGLYDEDGLLHHVGFCAGFSAAERAAVLARVEPLVRPPGFTGRSPGDPGRWSSARGAEWQPLATRLVAEVVYDHFTADRFRHPTRLLRWRPDKDPRACTFDQVRRYEVPTLSA
jgi:ATP-dependent DNA ligase